MSRQALKAGRSTFGERHPDTQMSLLNLAALSQAQGRLGKAEPWNGQALAGCRRALGEEHPDARTNLHRSATVLEARGRLVEEAEPL